MMTGTEVKKALFSAARNQHHKHTNYTKYALGERERERTHLSHVWGKVLLTVTSDQDVENCIFKKSSMLLKH